MVVSVKALACELPHELGLPLSRLSVSEIRREVLRRGLVASIGESTLWRWLSEDAIRPWHHRSWIFPRDPAFADKAGPILDLYAGTWQGQPLSPYDAISPPMRSPAFRRGAAAIRPTRPNPASR